MGWLHINPHYRTFLEQQGLRQAEDVLRLSGVIYCGHPDRHVAHVTLGTGDETVRAFLKKEHRVPWRDRLVNAWAGHGFVSKSVREMRMMQEVRAAGFDCPEVIAAGEAGGRAFLLLQEQSACSLRAFLEKTHDPCRRRAAAQELGAYVARLHDAGFVHGDLYAKHVLVTEGASQFVLIDWQRGSRRRRVGWSLRARELAALDATLPVELASPGERLRMVRAYLRAAAHGLPSVGLKRFARRIAKLSQRLQRRRHVREVRHTRLAPGVQNLIWLDGEALCVTRQFMEQLQGDVPQCLRLSGGPNRVQFEVLDIAEVGRVHLLRRWASRPWRWLWAKLRRRRFATPELEQAATLFRLQRLGVPTPRLLAVGQRFLRPWRSASFLLLQPLEGVPR